MIKVSVILPIYNVSKYLPKCLDSLLNQTLKEIEIICVNDSSPDNSLDVLEKYALNDQRVKIINQPNSGPGIARNNGIAEAKGKYIGFVDPDDWVDLDMFEKMYNAVEESQADLVECAVITHDEKTGKTKKKLNLYPVSNTPFAWSEYPNYVFHGITAAWNKLCRADVLKKNHIAFADARCAEDQIFAINIRISSSKIVYINEAFYHYLIRSTSLTQKPSKNNLIVPSLMSDVYNILKQKGVYDTLKEDFINNSAGLSAVHCNKTPKENREEYTRNCKQYLQSEAYELFLEYNKPYSFKDWLFSIRYKTKGNKRYKTVTLFGVKIKLK